jgi:signal transduction histidine kinase
VQARNPRVHVTLLFAVSDTPAIGIPQDQQRQILQAFTQADSSDDAAVRGHPAGNWPSALRLVD